MAPKKGTRLQVSSADIARMQVAAREIEDIRGTVAEHESGILAAVAPGAALLSAWRHYPEGDVYDPHTHAQYFYHAHPAEQRTSGEHGHFHTFLRAEGMPAGVAPLVLPETAVVDATAASPQAAPFKRGIRDEVSHLVAIALNERGQPIRLFTTNRWVTGETWYRGDDVIRMLDRFSIGDSDGPVLLNRLVTATVALFRPQIVSLLRLRDEAVMAWRRRRRTNVFEDTRLEVTSSFDIELDVQLSWLRELRASQSIWLADGSTPLRGPAEGWGEGRTR